eukprot:m51a1_g4472 WD40 repeat-containing protein (484) ;mRNA; r:245877-247712
MATSQQSEISQMDELLRFDAPVALAHESRWARKAREHSKTPQTPSKAATGDRFIPVHQTTNQLEASHQALLRAETDSTPSRPSRGADTTPSREAYKSTLSTAMLGEEDSTARVLSFSKKPAPKASASLQQSMRSLYVAGSEAPATRKPARFIPQAPERVLDAPDILDDYYLNLLDWSPNNVLAVALGQGVYLWDASSGGIQQLTSTTGDSVVTSLKWMRQGGEHLAVGTSEGEVQLWDVSRTKQLRCMRGHGARVGSLSWNGCQLASGSRDAAVLVHDVRIQQHVTAQLLEHTQEVCGLEWSPNGMQLASGANDNLLKIWEPQYGTGASKFTFDHHCAAVKALAWCPWQQGLLASGGGTADRCIKFWNTQTGACINSVDTRSQVTSLQWSTNYRELISAHGYSQNQLIVWKYPTMDKVCELTGHEGRILHTSRSPDGSVVVSAAADETLRFWSVWPARNAAAATAHKAEATKETSSLRYQLIR